MFEFGEQGYHEYRATQGGDKMNYNVRLGSNLAKADKCKHIGLMFLVVVIGACMASGFLYLIGAFLFRCWGA